MELMKHARSIYQGIKDREDEFMHGHCTHCGDEVDYNLTDYEDFQIKINLIRQIFSVSEIRQYLSENMRCKSLSQSYNFYDNQDQVLLSPQLFKKAELILQKPVFYKDLLDQPKTWASLSKTVS